MAEEPLDSILAFVEMALDSMETRPLTWGGPEAVELQYRLLLDIIAISKGIDRKQLRAAYRRLKAFRSALPLSARHKATHESMRRMTKKLSELRKALRTK